MGDYRFISFTLTSDFTRGATPYMHTYCFFPGFAHGSHVPQRRLKYPNTCSPPTREIARCKSHNQLFNSVSLCSTDCDPNQSPESTHWTERAQIPEMRPTMGLVMLACLPRASDLPLGFWGTCTASLSSQAANWAGYSPDTLWRGTKVLGYY